MTGKRLQVVAASVLAGFVAAAQGGTIAHYDFSYDANADVGHDAGPPSDLADVPYYIFDQANSGFGINPNIRNGPPAKDLSGKGRDLHHEYLFTGVTAPSSNVHPRWVTSTVAAGGSGDQGVMIAAANNLHMRTADTFTVGEYTGGFMIDMDIEVERTSAMNLELALLSLPGIQLALDKTSPATGGVPGGIVATIQGTFGANTVASSTSVLKTGSQRPSFNIKLLYDPDMERDGVHNLFLFINDQLEDAHIATGITLANGTPFDPETVGHLNLLGDDPGSRLATNIMVKRLAVYVPEPSSLAVIGLALPMIARRRRGR